MGRVARAYLVGEALDAVLEGLELDAPHVFHLRLHRGHRFLGRGGMARREMR